LSRAGAAARLPRAGWRAGSHSEHDLLCPADDGSRDLYLVPLLCLVDYRAGDLLQLRSQAHRVRAARMMRWIMLLALVVSAAAQSGAAAAKVFHAAADVALFNLKKETKPEVPAGADLRHPINVVFHI